MNSELCVIEYKVNVPSKLINENKLHWVIRTFFTQLYVFTWLENMYLGPFYTLAKVHKRGIN